MTTIVQCISGMTSGLLHLFLRGIGPLVTHRADPASAPYQYMDGPKDQSCLNIIDHLQNPIRVISVKRNKSIRSPPAGFLKALEEGHPQENREEKPQPQIVSPPPQAVLSPYHHKRNQSSAYSIFPASPPMPVIISSSNPKPSSPLVRSPSKSPINLTRTTPQNSSPTPSLFPLPPSIETILGLPSPQPSLSSGISATSLLLPPPPCRRSRPFSFTSVTSMGHKRKSSIGSTTTVQIGLRLSHALPLSYTLHHSHVQEKAQSPPSIQKDEQGVAAEVLPLLHGQNLAREPHQAESSPQAAAQSWEKSLKEAQLPHDHHFRPPPRLRIHPLRQIHIISSPPQSPRSLAPPALRIVHINGRSKSNAAATSFSAHRAEVALRSPSLPHLNIPSNPSRKLNSHGEDICMKTLPPTPHTPSPAPTTATTTPAALPLRSLSLRDFGASNNSNVSAITRSSQLVRLGLDLDLALGLAPGGASGLMSPDLLSSGFLSSGILSPVSSMGSPKASSLMRARTGVVRFVMHKSQSRDDGEWF
ncbi:MAG: hypothetical protein M1829_003793 [Trizodia sp. TS-e1964]|nr:MAG: hypothetical protein M1829_003793 [Trizodia sp. TS-e1964]